MSMTEFITTPDSIPSLENSSFASSDANEDTNDSKRVLFIESPTDIEVSVLKNSKRPKVLEVVSPDTTVSTNSSLVGSEFLSIGSDEWINSPSNIHQQKKAFRTVDCIDVVPAIAAPTYTPKLEYVSLADIETRKDRITEDDDVVVNAITDSDEDETINVSFCSDNFMSPSGGSIFHMFDVTPTIWPGWSLMSSHRTSSPSLNGEKEETTSNLDLSLSSPAAFSPDTRFKWTPLDRSSIDPVFEAYTPPRKSSRDLQKARELGRQQLSQKFEQYANEEPLDQEFPTISAVDSQTDAETTIASNVDVTGANKEWERKVDDLGAYIHN
jgi:hypothetical protein